jgi:hypothetical protein
MNIIMNTEDGHKVWRNPAGQVHREDGPAIIKAHGDREWWICGRRHRSDGPAVVFSESSKFWYFEGLLHRTDGPAIEYSEGSKEWHLRGMRHRLDGPAVEFREYKVWYIKNKRVSKPEVVNQVSQLHLKVLLLTRVINPFCEINVAKYAL